MTDSPILEFAVQISKAINWLVVTREGWMCLGVGLIAILLIRFLKALRQRSLLFAASGKKMGVFGGSAVLLEEILFVGASLVANIPTLVAAFAVLGVVVALSGVVTRLDDFLNVEQKLKEYSLVLKNLERRYKVARVECVAQKDGKTKLRIVYFDQNGKSVNGGEEELEIEGTDIFVDALVVNFAYFGIESGDKRNIAVPYRVFSEKVPQKEGLPLKIASYGKVPYYFYRSKHQIFGVEKHVFDTRLTELLNLISDAEKSRQAGLVRSLYGNAVHRVMKKGDAFFIWVEQSGGLTIKEAVVF